MKTAYRKSRPVSSTMPDGGVETVRRSDRTERIRTCRYLRRGAAGQCTAEAVGTEDDDVQLCIRHLAAALHVLREHADTNKIGVPA